MQMTARTPTMTAMTAATLDLLSRGRFILGLGVSGPAVVEGWHAQRYGSPIARTREYVQIIRTVWARQRLDLRGCYYRVPYDQPDGTGLGEPIRLMFRPRRPSLPIYLAAMGPRNVSLAYEIADGLIPAFYSPHREEAFFQFSGSVPPKRKIELAPFVPVAMGPDLQACRDLLKPGLAFWIGGMGAKGLNFYNRFISRLGFAEAADSVQRSYTQGHRMEAVRAIPDALVDEIALCGPRLHVAEQLEAWKRSSVTTMILNGASVDAIVAIAELLL
jgi:F420-dependent oxidoreductase-like protein